MKFLILLVFFSINSFANEKSNIAVVDMDKIINQTLGFQEFNLKINKYISKQNQKIELLKNKKKKNKKILSLKLLSSESIANKDKESIIIDKKIHLIVLESQEYIKEEEIKVKNKIIRKIMPLIDKYSKDNNLILTIDISTIVYESKIKFIDISNAISIIYNNKYSKNK